MADRARWVVVALMVAGAILRLVALIRGWDMPLRPDAQGFLALARDFTFADPWAAMPREPLWIALVKVVTAPFGYAPQALRVATTVVSIAVLPATWLLLRRVLAVRSGPRRCSFTYPARGRADLDNPSRWIVVLTLGAVAFSGQLISLAPQGLRTSLTTLLFTVCVLALLAAPHALARRCWLVGVPIVVLAVVRWELGLLTAGLAVIAVLVRRLSWVVPAVAAVVVAVLVGPWFASNAAAYDDPLYHSNVRAVWYRNMEIWADVPEEDQPVDSYAGPPITWRAYFLEFVGPRQVVVRTARGLVQLPAELVSKQARFYLALTAGRPPGQIPRGPLGLVVAGGATLITAVGLWRSRAERAAVALTIAGLGVAAYAPIAGAPGVGFDERLLAFVVPIGAFVLASGLAGFVDASRESADREVSTF